MLGRVRTLGGGVVEEGQRSPLVGGVEVVGLLRRLGAEAVEEARSCGSNLAKEVVEGRSACRGRAEAVVYKVRMELSVVEEVAVGGSRGGHLSCALVVVEDRNCALEGEVGRSCVRVVEVALFASLERVVARPRRGSGHRLGLLEGVVGLVDPVLHPMQLGRGMVGRELRLAVVGRVCPRLGMVVGRGSETVAEARALEGVSVIQSARLRLGVCVVRAAAPGVDLGLTPKSFAGGWKLRKVVVEEVPSLCAHLLLLSTCVVQYTCE